MLKTEMLVWVVPCLRNDKFKLFWPFPAPRVTTSLIAHANKN